MRVGGGVPKSQGDEVVDMDLSREDRADDAADRETESVARLFETRLPRSVLSAARPMCPLDHCVFGVAAPFVAFVLEKGCRPRLTGRDDCFIHTPDPPAP